MEKLNLQGHKAGNLSFREIYDSIDGSRPSQGVQKLLSITGFPESTDRTHWHKQ